MSVYHFYNTELYAPIEYIDADESVKKNICNGCGPAKAKFDFIPDSIFGVSIHEACQVHDWMYEFGKTINDKDIADRVFLNNMIRLIDGKTNQWKWTRKLRKRIAWGYYEAVVKFGGSAYWDGKN